MSAALAGEEMAPLMYEGAFPAEEASLAVTAAELTELGEFLLFPIQLVRVRPKKRCAHCSRFAEWGLMETRCGSFH